MGESKKTTMGGPDDDDDDGFSFLFWNSFGDEGAFALPPASSETRT